MSREIYLTGVLGEIPTEGATQVLLDKIKAGKPVEEMELSTLAHIGSASAIEPLYQMWKPGDHLLAEYLLILCELNGVQKPELPEWRRLVEAQDERLSKAMSGEASPLERLNNLSAPFLPTQPGNLSRKKARRSLAGEAPLAKRKIRNGLLIVSRPGAKRRRSAGRDNIEPGRAASDVQSARKFVARIETYLRQEGWL